MKRILVFFLAILLFPTYAFAQAKHYDLPEAELKVVIPGGHYVLTRDSKLGDPEIEGLTFNEGLKKFQENLVKNDTYLYAIDRKETYDLNLKVSDLSNFPRIGDFIHYSNEELDRVYQNLREAYKKLDIRLKDYEIAKVNGMTYLLMRSDPTVLYGQTTTILQYFTAYNSKAYIFTLQSFSKEIAPEMEDTLREIVELTQYTVSPSRLPKEPGLFTKFKYVLFGILLLVLLAIILVIRKRKTTF